MGEGELNAGLPVESGEVRHTGITTIGDVPWGTHFCQFYQDKQDLIDILVPFFKAGLKNNEFCMWVTSEPLRAAEAKAALAANIENLETYITNGQLEILDTEWYTFGEKFESDRVLQSWVDRLEAATRRGFDGLRLTGNTFWLEKPEWHGFMEYEATVDTIFEQNRILAICTYSLSRCGALQIMDVISNHAFALVKRAGKWEVIQSAERKKVETTLRESEERFRRVFEEGPLGLALVGRDYRFLKVNGALCQMVGYPEAELVQMSFADITHPDDVRADVELAEQLFKHEIPFYRIEKRYMKKTGEIIWINLTASMILGPDGEPLHGLAMIEDITERKRAQEESFARQKLESLGTLASGIAHDFNNLLGGVMAQAELALEEYQAGSSPVEELKRIKDGAIRGSEIVRQLMIYAGKESEAVGLADVSQVARGMVELLKVSISKRAALVTDFSKDLPAVRGSTGEIQQIVMNLVTNASEALEDRDGVIRVTTRSVNVDRVEAVSKGIAEGDYVELEVADNGRGMSLETQARIFDPFFTTKSQGHGLGMGVVRGIVRGLGGAIHLASQLGKGTTFQIFLPSTGIVTGASGPLPCVGESRAPQLVTILVVEDDDALRVALAQILRRRGFETLDAANGADAINLLRANSIKIDMMLLDMTIPGPSSREVAALAAEARPGLKVVLTSAYDEKLVRTTVSATQACGFVRKPFQIDELVYTLRSALSLRATTG